MLQFDDPCILFALSRESAPFLRQFSPQQRFPDAPCWARFCGPAWLTVLVVESGLGRERTESALGWALSRPRFGNLPYQPKVVISAGFSGALQDSFQVGDIILASEVTDQEGNRWATTWPEELPAGKWQPPLHRGRLLSVPHLVGEPSEKLRLGRLHDAVAVDMETATVARLCRRYEVPFACVRAISDRVDTPLSPRLVSLLSNGQTSPMRMLVYLARSPGLAGEMWRLARHTRKAAALLAQALGELLTLTLPFGSEL